MDPFLWKETFTFINIFRQLPSLPLAVVRLHPLALLLVPHTFALPLPGP